MLYLSDGEVYKRFFTTVKKVIRPDAQVEDYDANIYTQIAAINGMVEIIDAIMQEEEKE